MRIPRIFTDQPLSRGTKAHLEAQASRHLSSVLRKKVGAELILFNGQGGEYIAQLTSVDSRQAVALVVDSVPGVAPSPLHITLAIALSRGERMDWVVQKAVEMGVQNIVPLFTARSEVKLGGERAAKKLRHWQQVARSACEQSGQNLVTDIAMPANFPSALQTTADCRIVLDPLAEQSLRQAMTQFTDQTPPRSVYLLSGPEGGFSADEIGQCRTAGLISTRLGPRVLRTETAPLAALALLQAQWGDWQ